MANTTSSRQSLWLDTAPPSEYPSLSGDVEVDIAVIGGGVAGLTSALMLHDAGARVALLEAGRVGHGVTGCTTAKVSALQGTIYTRIAKRHGAKVAAIYAEASAAGVEGLAGLVAAHTIDCDLHRRAACTYAATPSQRAAVAAEAAAAGAAGLPVELTDSNELPFTTYATVRLGNQLELHPVRYAQGLAAALTGGGSHVFENSRAVTVREGTPCEVVTSQGTVRATHVVIATHFPFLDRGGYFARLKPQRSYCIAARLADDTPPTTMAISAGSPTRSVRSHGAYLIVGGEGHPTGTGEAVPERFEALEDFARAHWDIESMTHRWSAQDASHYDRLPLVGPYRPGAHHLWVTAGFMKWGFASATFAAMILKDQIAGRANRWAATFTPTRLSPRSLFEVGQLGVKFTGHLLGDRVRPPSARSAAEDVPRGQARVVGTTLDRAGVYRAEDGSVHAVSLRCTHMGCLLHFNAAETSWDCPCHGSRFDVDGAVLEGPATQALAKREI
jgi:glycine/D-amino acid oxidase-like deaminating enzyme/nitrite reductase/ring-hydroxylating ferredoxin subunit